jgi:hypothetical protein
MSFFPAPPFASVIVFLASRGDVVFVFAFPGSAEPGRHHQLTFTHVTHARLTRMGADIALLAPRPGFR